MAKNDDSVKTGPGLYGLFTTTARERTVIESAEEHKVTLKADLDISKSRFANLPRKLPSPRPAQPRGLPFNRSCQLTPRHFSTSKRPWPSFTTFAL